MFLTIGDLGCATHCLLRAIDIDSANADAYYYLGLTSTLKGELEEAAELFTHALDIQSEHIGALRDSAFVYLAMGKLNDATNRINKARSLAVDSMEINTLDRRIRLAKQTELIRRILSRFKPRFN
jgi:tetratricopeptide (TPR) repeat protein